MKAIASISCYSCTHPIKPSHEGVNLLCCRHCYKVYRKSQDSFSDDTSHLLVHPTITSIQPGSTGTWNHLSFTVLGRCRLSVEDTIMNYWTILFSTGSLGWIREQYGLLYIIPDLTNQGTKFDKALQPTQELWDTVIVEQLNFQLVQTATCKQIALENETYFPVLGKQVEIREWINDANSGVICFSQGKEKYYYPFIPIPEGVIRWSNLREIKTASQQFPCQFCDVNISLPHFPYEQSVVCENCGYGHYAAEGELKKSVYKYDTKYKAKSALKIGATGILQGISYTVKGVVVKQEDNVYKSKWREYYLQTDLNEWATLSEYNGHWILIKEMNDPPFLKNAHASTLFYGQQEFHRYNQYKYSVINAAGSFPYNIFETDNTHCVEYIAPPQLLIHETNPVKGICWFKGEHISAKSLKDTFTPTPSLPYAHGVGAVTPLFTDKINRTSFLITTLIAFVLMLSVHMLIGSTKEKIPVLPMNTYVFMDSSNQLKVEPITLQLHKSSSNLLFDIAAPVSNSWFSLAVNLRNKDNGKTYSFEQGVEYYSGVEDGESWSEGSISEQYRLNDIPAGNYVLEMEGTREMRSFNLLPSFTMEVVYDVVIDNNLWWALGILSIWPIFTALMMRYNHYRRWKDSPFSNYNTE